MAASVIEIAGWRQKRLSLPANLISKCNSLQLKVLLHRRRPDNLLRENKLANSVDVIAISNLKSLTH